MSSSPTVATATPPVLSRSTLRSPAKISSAPIGHYTIAVTTYRIVVLVNSARSQSAPSLSLVFFSTAPRWSSSLSSSSSSQSSSSGRGGLLMDRCHPATRQMAKIQRLGFECPMMTAIRTTGHTHG